MYEVILAPIFSHGSYALWSSYLAGGEVIVADGYSEHKQLNSRFPGTLFPLLAADIMNWTIMWDDCYNRTKPGVLTGECESQKTRYGID